MNDRLREAEQAITQAMIDGSLANARLQTVLRRLDQGRYAVPLTVLRLTLVRRRGLPTGEALHAALHDLYRHRQVHVADLQILAIGFYRMVWHLLVQLDPAVALDDIRRLDAGQSASLCYGFTFGVHPRPFPLPTALCARIRGRLEPILHAPEADHDWRAAAPPPAAMPAITVSDRDLTPAANAIRNSFFAEVLIEALGGDGPPTAAGTDALADEALVMDFLRKAGSAPQHLPGLRQVTLAQVRFRLAQLTLALIGLHQVEAAGQGSEPPSSIPFIEAAAGCVLSPIASLRSWLRANRHHLLIPVISHSPGADAEVVGAPRPTLGAGGWTGGRAVAMARPC